MDRLKLKNSAKESLKGHYGEFFKMLLVCVLISFCIGFVAGILDGVCKTTWVVGKQELFGQSVDQTVGLFGTIGSIIDTCLFTFGITSFFLKISRNEEVTYKELFSKINLAVFYFALTFVAGLFISLWTLLLIIPGIIATYAYKMIYYIKLDNPEIGVLDAIKKSKEMMNGHKWDFFVLELSFIGWIILGVFTLGILYLWLVPYMAVTECNFYNSIKD